ncbi:MAG: DNA polymerase Y family protein [Terriglobia bacterium]
MTFACLHIPDFLLQANLRDEAGKTSPLDHALALVEGAFPRVVAATRKAREAGVTLGMTAVEAASFAATRHRSVAQEDSAHAALLDCARSCSPRVENTAADTVVIDLEGLDRLLGPPSRIATRLLRQAEGLGLTIRVAVAANPDTAILAARGFNGITIISPGEEAQRLGELSVSVLHPQPETLGTLGRWGIYRLKELAGLPLLPLSERLGQEGMRLQKLARGKHCRSLMAAGEAERFEESWELEDPAVTLDELDFVLSSLLIRLCKRLTMRSLATQEMRLHLDLAAGMEPEPSLALEEQRRKTSGKEEVTAPDPSLGSSLTARPYERALSFPFPINNARLFFKLWRLRLESDLPRSPVAKITIIAQPARSRSIQGGLFAPLAPDPEKLELTLARIAAVVGSGNVGSPEILDTHRPHAFRIAGFNPAENRRIPRVAPALSPGENRKGVGEDTTHRRGSNPGTQCMGQPRALENEVQPMMAIRLFRPPIAARVELNQGAPSRLFSCQAVGKIAFAVGPWRRSGGWWEEEKWDREEWDIEIRTGEKAVLYSIYHNLADGKWYLQGEYD